jgi:hypothetical protein
LATYILVSLFVLFRIGEAGLLDKQSPGLSPVGVMIPVALLLLVCGTPTFLAGFFLFRRSQNAVARVVAFCGMGYFLGIVALFVIGLGLHGLQ